MDHLDMTQLLDEAAANGDSRVQDGSADDTTTLEILQRAMHAQQEAGAQGWILEGFPRNQQQMQMLEEAILVPQLLVVVGNPSGELEETLQLIKSGCFKPAELRVNAEDDAESIINRVIDIVEPENPPRPIFSLLAPPTCGRREQAEGLAAQLRLQRICVGDLLRREVDKGTQIGEEVRSTIASGELVPDSLVTDLLKIHLQNLDTRDSTSGVLLDGYPRTVAQTEALQELGFVPSVVLLMEVHDAVAEERATAQGISHATQEARNTAYGLHFESTVSSLEENAAILRVNGTGSPQQVFDRLLTEVESFLPLHQTPYSLLNAHVPPTFLPLPESGYHSMTPVEARSGTDIYPDYPAVQLAMEEFLRKDNYEMTIQDRSVMVCHNPDKILQHCNRMAHHLDQEKFESLKARVTKNGVSLDKCIKPGVENAGRKLGQSAGLVAGDEECYYTFSELFDPVISDLHGALSSVPRNVDSECVDMAALSPAMQEYVKSSQISFSRNISGLPFPPSCTPDERKQIESFLVEAIQQVDNFSEEYLPLANIDSATEATLRENHPAFSAPETGFFMSAGLHNDWPESRGVFQNKDDLRLWCNEEDHILLTSTQPGSDIQAALARAAETLDRVEAALKQTNCVFAFDKDLGFLTSLVSCVGPAMKASMVLQLPKTASKTDDLRAICGDDVDVALVLNYCLAVLVSPHNRAAHASCWFSVGGSWRAPVDTGNKRHSKVGRHINN